MTMFRRSGTACVAAFSPEEAQVLRQCVAELAALISDGIDRDDPAVERLFPDVYPEDPADEEELRRFTEDDLVSARREQISSVLAGLLEGGGEVRLDDDSADTWLRTLTDVRLALGVRLGIRDDTDIEEELDEAVLADPTSSRVGQISVYAYLTYLQESLVASLLG